MFRRLLSPLKSNSFFYSVRKRQSTQPKFYFFYPGVKRALDFTVSQELFEGSYVFGNAFEHLVILELIRLNDYFRRDFRFSYLRTASGREVDLILERPGLPVALVEIKSCIQVTEEDCVFAGEIAKEIPGAIPFCISRDPYRKTIGAVRCVPYLEAAGELGFI